MKFYFYKLKIFMDVFWNILKGWKLSFQLVYTFIILIFQDVSLYIFLAKYQKIFNTNIMYHILRVHPIWMWDNINQTVYCILTLFNLIFNKSGDIFFSVYNNFHLFVCYSVFDKISNKKMQKYFSNLSRAGNITLLWI